METINRLKDIHKIIAELLVEEATLFDKLEEQVKK